MDHNPVNQPEEGPKRRALKNMPPVPEHKKDRFIRAVRDGDKKAFVFYAKWDDDRILYLRKMG